MAGGAAVVRGPRSVRGVRGRVPRVPARRLALALRHGGLCHARQALTVPRSKLLHCPYQLLFITFNPVKRSPGPN